MSMAPKLQNLESKSNFKPPTTLTDWIDARSHWADRNLHCVPIVFDELPDHLRCTQTVWQPPKYQRTIGGHNARWCSAITMRPLGTIVEAERLIKLEDRRVHYCSIIYHLMTTVHITSPLKRPFYAECSLWIEQLDHREELAFYFGIRSSDSSSRFSNWERSLFWLRNWETRNTLQARVGIELFLKLKNHSSCMIHVWKQFQRNGRICDFRKLKISQSNLSTSCSQIWNICLPRISPFGRNYCRNHCVRSNRLIQTTVRHLANCKFQFNGSFKSFLIFRILKALESLVLRTTCSSD